MTSKGGGRPKGLPKTGGRAKGTTNKVTKDVRAAIAAIAEEKADDVKGWLNSVAAEDPAKALDLYLRMIEYHIPKLARSEVTGEGGGAIVLNLSRADERI